jgi:serine/threonine protein kinase
MNTSMNPERWQRLTQIVNDCLEVSASQRGARLRELCAGDDTLLREAMELIATAERTQGFLDEPASLDAITRHPAPGELSRRIGQALTHIGQRLGAYRLTEELARGGMGVVYKAVRADDSYQKEVAIKLLRDDVDAAQVAERFRAERQILAGLEHPNIARLIDGGTTSEGLPYLVMEYVDGEPITQYARRGELDVPARLQLFRTVCNAVHFAHQRLVVHRDLKPNNIFVTRTGDVKLLDFGIAKVLDISPSAAALATTVHALTPAYASPEQIKGESVTTTSDIYALGVVLYELLTGHSPYKSARTQPLALAKEICETDPERPSTVVGRTETGGAEVGDATPAALNLKRLQRGLRGDLDNIVLMALRKDATRRYASAEQMSEDIRRYLADLPVSARPDTFAYRATKFVTRNRWAVAFALLAAAGLIAGIFSTVQQANIAREAQAKAEAERERAQRHFAIARKFSAETIDTVMNELRGINGTQPLRRQLMAKTVAQFEALRKDAGEDPKFLAEIGRGYALLATTQGDFGDIPIAEVLQNHESAETLLKRAHQLAPTDVDIASEIVSHASSYAGTLTANDNYATARDKLQAAAALGKEFESRGTIPAKLKALIAINLMDAGSLDRSVCPRETCLPMLREARSRMEALLATGEAGANNELVSVQLGQTYFQLAVMLNNSVVAAERAEADFFLGKMINSFEQIMRTYPDKARYDQVLVLGYLGRAVYRNDVKRYAEAATDIAKARELQTRQAATNPGERTANILFYAIDVVQADIAVSMRDIRSAQTWLDHGATVLQEIGDPSKQISMLRAAWMLSGGVQARLDMAVADDVATPVARRRLLYRKAIDGFEVAASLIEKNLGDFDAYEVDRPARLRADAEKCKEALANLR